jgi:carboxyl-terminal processing protease
MKRTLLVSLLLVCFSFAAFSSDQKINDRTFRISKNMSVFNSVFRELDAFYVDTLNYDKMSINNIRI